MGFAEAWRRRVLSAAGAGASVPAVVVCTALLVGVGGGGLGGVGALSQVLEGPRAPGGAGDPGAEERRAARQDRDAARLLASVGPATAGGAAGGGASGDVRGRPPAGGGGGGGGGGDAPAPAAPPDAEPAPAPAPPPAPAPAPPPGEPSSIVRQVGDQVTAITDPVPIVGEPVGGVVDTLVDAVESLPRL